MFNHNEYQNVDLHYDKNDHPWDDDERCSYDSRNRPKTRYHQASQEVRFQEDQSRTNKTMCLNCSGTGYFTIGENECNELQTLTNCIEQISVPFHENNDEIDDQFNDDDDQ